MYKAYLHTKARKIDGSGYDCYFTQELPVKVTDCPRNPYATGYGGRIPTQYMVKYNNRWQRVYCVCYSNSGTLYIGNKYSCLSVIQIEGV